MPQPRYRFDSINGYFVARSRQQAFFRRYRKQRALIRDALHQKFLLLIEQLGPAFFRYGQHHLNAKKLGFDYWQYHDHLNDLMRSHPHLYQLRKHGRLLPALPKPASVSYTPNLPYRQRHIEATARKQAPLLPILPRRTFPPIWPRKRLSGPRPLSLLSVSHLLQDET